MNPPTYRHSLRMLFPFLNALTGRPASLSRACALMIQDAHPTPRALNTLNIPAESPFILAMNHYDRPGMGAWWAGAFVAATIAAHRTDRREIHPVMAREWWYPPGWERRIKQPLTRWAFGQLAKTFGIITVPPVIDEYKGTGGLDIRRAVALTRGDQPELIGITPEGYTGEGRKLKQPPAGAGLFLQMLSHDKIPFLPVGVYEGENQTLTANFGATFMLNVPRALPREQRDSAAARQVMVHVGKLLPEWMWGFYKEDVRTSFK